MYIETKKQKDKNNRLGQLRVMDALLISIVHVVMKYKNKKHETNEIEISEEMLEIILRKRFLKKTSNVFGFYWWHVTTRRLR